MVIYYQYIFPFVKIIINMFISRVNESGRRHCCFVHLAATQHSWDAVSWRDQQSPRCRRYPFFLTENGHRNQAWYCEHFTYCYTCLKDYCTIYNNQVDAHLHTWSCVPNPVVLYIYGWFSIKMPKSDFHIIYSKILFSLI